MRAVVIDPAKGADQTVDPRVAPDGTMVRVENMRVDKYGRLVMRSGYVAMSRTIKTGFTMSPIDLAAIGETLVCLGNDGNTQGVTDIYTATQLDARGQWRSAQGVALPTSSQNGQFLPTAVDGLKITYSDHEASPGVGDVWCDVSASADGNYVAMVREDDDQNLGVTVVVNATTGTLENISSTSTGGRNPKTLAIGSVFYFFAQDTATNDISVRTWDSAGAGNSISAATSLATGVSAFPASYSVALFEGTTDYLLVFPTATGYTWRRFDSAHVQQTTTNVVSLANAPVDICGATGELISVVSVRAVNGADVRSFTAATGVLATGPTNIDTSLVIVYNHVTIARVSATQHIAALGSAAGALPTERTFGCSIVPSTGATSALFFLNGFHPASRPLSFGTPNPRAFIWGTVGLGTQRTQEFVALPLFNSTGDDPVLNATALPGKARGTWSASAASRFSAIARVGNKLWVGLVSFDPRDRSYRCHILECNCQSSSRRQTVVLGRSLIIAGGVTASFDGRVSSELGFDQSPSVITTLQVAGGGLTLLGTYTYLFVFRSVSANDEVTQSAPSNPTTVTLTGGNQSLTITVMGPYSARVGTTPDFHGMNVFLDVYRTEAGGSIPRVVSSQLFTSVTNQLGNIVVFTDSVTDAVQQTGALIYTQGADGAVSGRLPLAIASASGSVSESSGKLLLAGLERANQAQLSIESRPGESIGFVNDDLFFVTSPDSIVAATSSTDGRRFLFGRRTIRELIGEGPNAAGVGDISEPVDISTNVGALDWRSICKTEHGVFFQSQAAPEPRIYLLPIGGGLPFEVSAGIRETLALYPTIVSATRHDDEQMLTFTCVNTAGDDSRLVHLDLKTSGMSKNGWRATWLVDRNYEFEFFDSPSIIDEQLVVIPNVLTGTVTIDLPKGGRVSDRIIMAVCAEFPAAQGSIATPAAFTSLTTVSGASEQLLVCQRNLTTLTDITATSTTMAVTVTGGGGGALVIKQWLVRNHGHGSGGLCEVTTVALAAGTAWTLPTLTPTWGSARTLFLTGAYSSQGNTDPSAPVITTLPTGFSTFTRAEFATAAGGANQTIDSVFGSQRPTTAVTALAGVGFAAATAGDGVAFLLGVRPFSGTGGTPLRASVAHLGQLVVCNQTRVYRATAGALQDTGLNGLANIRGEIETADIFPMGPGGAGRHLGIDAMGEILGFTDIYAAVSYDSGLTWTQLRMFRLTAAFGFQIGQTVRLQWVPKRRKIDGVRVRIVQGSDPSISGGTAGFAINQLTLWFDDLAGQTRIPTGAAGGQRR